MLAMTTMMPPIVPPLEPLPLDELSPLELPPPQRKPAAYRRRCTAALAMLMAGCHGGVRGGESDDELRCRYPSKLCYNTRVRKGSGGLHRYCAFHRDKANANQKRWVGRQRGGAETSPTASSSSSCSSPGSSASSSPTSTKGRWVAATSFRAPSASAATLSDDDWDALLSLLDAAAAPAKTKPAGTLRPRRRRPVPTFGRRQLSPLE